MLVFPAVTWNTFGNLYPTNGFFALGCLTENGIPWQKTLSPALVGRALSWFATVNWCKDRRYTVLWRFRRPITTWLDFPLHKTLDKPTWYVGNKEMLIFDKINFIARAFFSNKNFYEHQ